MRGGTRLGAGRKPGAPNRKTDDLRSMMESITPGNEPVPVVLLRLGFKYHQQEKHSEAIQAIGRAMEFAYPKLKAIEHSGEIKSIPTLEVFLSPPPVDVDAP